MVRNEVNPTDWRGGWGGGFSVKLDIYGGCFAEVGRRVLGLVAGEGGVAKCVGVLVKKQTRSRHVCYRSAYLKVSMVLDIHNFQKVKGKEEILYGSV